MDGEARFSYDSLSDSLIISVKSVEEKVKRNFMFDDFVISLNGRGKVVALEVREVSAYLKQVGVDSVALKTMKGAQLTVRVKRDFIYIGFAIAYLLDNHLVERALPVANIPCALAH